VRTLHVETREVDLEYQIAIEEFDSQVPTPESMQNEPLFLEELHTDQVDPVAQSPMHVSPDTFDILMEATNQVDYSTIFELVVLQERIKLFEYQNSSLAQTNVMYSQ